MNYIDLKYSRLVSPYLKGWRETGNGVAQFRCPFCGDSKKSEVRTRGYFYTKNDECNFRCHNCNAGMGLLKFLAEIAPTLAGQYIFERFTAPRRAAKKEEEVDLRTNVEERLTITSDILAACTKITDLDEEHHAYQYLIGRKIPRKHLNRLFYIEDVRELCRLVPGYKEKAKTLPKKDCIVIPFFDEESTLMYVQCRFFSEDFRYMTLEVEEHGKKLWGLNYIDWDKKVYVCEGPFDAMFLDNCIAVAGVSILSEVKYLQERTKAGLVLIFDKDYTTNYEVYSLLKKAVNLGLSVVLFDKHFEGKDINAQVKDHGMSEQDLKNYIDRRTFRGLMANLELSKFRPPQRRIIPSHGEKKASFY